MNLTLSAENQRLRFLADVPIQPASSEPPPGKRIVHLADGRFLASDTAFSPATVTLWTPTGEFATSIGRHGTHHVDFGERGRLAVLPVEDGGFYVRDGEAMWWRFDDRLNLTGKLHRPGIGTVSWAQANFPNGIIVTTQRMTGQPTRGFQLWRLEDGSRTLFGPDIEVEAPLTRASRESFWAAWTTEVGYVLEQWDLSGKRHNSIGRTFSEPEQQRLSTPVRVSMIHSGSDQHIIVFVVHPVERDKQGRRDESHMTLLVDVVDTGRAEVLSSTVTTVQLARTAYPTAFFENESRGYYYAQDAEGGRAAVVTYALEPVV